MRKFIAALIVAVLVPFTFAGTSDAANRGEDKQVQALKAKVKDLRTQRNFWYDEVHTLDNLLAEERNKPKYPAFTGSGEGNTVVYRIVWTENGVQFFSNPLYTRDQMEVFRNIVSEDSDTVPGSVSVQTSTVGPWS